jgi:signal recognition particle subunit SRP54
MGKLPGFKQFAQMKKLANMDLGALMGAGGGLPPGFGGDGGGGAGGMPGMPAMPGIPTGNIPGLPKGYTPPGTKSLVGNQRANDKQRSRDKRKAEKAARKKNRR